MGTSRGRDAFSLDDFALGEEIGKGGFGTVCTATCKRGRLANTEVAIKKVSSKQRSELVRQEVENHQNINHENIVKFYGCFKENDDTYIVMELCSKGSLRQYIKDRREAFSQGQAVYILRQIVDAIQHLHSKGICHRDLTAGNVLVHRIRQNGDVNVKLCDFGLAKVMNAGRAAHTVAGTPGYMDPHVMHRDKYGKEVDVYALGCLLYTMLTGFEPVPDAKARFPRLKSLESEAIDLIEQLTDPDVNRRMKLEHIKSSAFMTSRASLSMDQPTSFRSRRSTEQKSRERRPLTSTEQQRSVRDRSKSRGPPLREINTQSPPAQRQLCRSRSASQVRAAAAAPTANAHQDWPIDHRLIHRLKGKHEEADGYRLDIDNNEAVLSEYESGGQTHDGRKIMVVHVEERGQKVRSVVYRRDRDDPTWEWRRSMEALSSGERRQYNIVLKLLERIRWKVAKVIFNNSSICKGGVIKLMENGDLRMKDRDDKLYSVRAGSNVVYEGNPRNPSGTVSDPAKRDEILGYREWCRYTEAGMERMRYAFPYISYDISDDSKTVLRNAREARAESSRVRVPSGMGERAETSREVSVQRVSRAKSTASHVRKTVTDAAVTTRSAPAGSMQQCDKENAHRQITTTKSKSGKILGVTDKTAGTSLRKSGTAPNVYIYTSAEGIQRRFTFTGDYSALSPSEAFLMQKLLR